MIQLVPAIDIIEGRCVRLSQGDYNVRRNYDTLPADQARMLQDCGVQRLHVVDLDGAKASAPANLFTLEKIANACPGLTIEWGGGIKSTEALQSVFSAGAQCAIIGSVAVKKPELMEQWLQQLGGGRVALGADARGGKIATDGWLESSEATVASLVDHFLPFGLNQMICTDISRDGMLQGVDCKFYQELQNSYPTVDVTVSGGISSMADIEELAEAGLRRVIIGKAMYEGRITINDISSFIKQNGSC